jgi:hypothetical protein
LTTPRALVYRGVVEKMGKEGRKREEKERKKTNFLDKKLV